MTTPELLTRDEEVEALADRSRRRPTFVFKHSLTCPISSSAWQRYLSFVSQESPNDRADFTAVEIQKARPISDRVAERFDVRHESPQAMLLSDGEVVWHASHGSITEETLADALQSVSE